MMEKIWKNYGTYIKFASENSKIPANMLTSFIAVESGGNATAGGSGSKTQGLMQWNRDYAQAQLETELKQGRMTPAEKDKLATFGIKFNNAGKTRAITQADQIKPELNILIGSIVLGQLVDTSWGTQDGVIRLDRVISVYNAGAYGDTGKKARLGNYATPAALAAAVNSTTRAYIQKIMGKDGALDIATSDLKDVIK
jgi:soluble lytic murein transglycosylase-like protein